MRGVWCDPTGIHWSAPRKDGCGLTILILRVWRQLKFGLGACSGEHHVILGVCWPFTKASSFPQTRDSGVHNRVNWSFP